MGLSRNNSFRFAEVLNLGRDPSKDREREIRGDLGPRLS